MASKKILLLLSSDRFAYPLIRFLAEEAKKFTWKLRIGCVFDAGMAERIARQKFAVEPEFLSIAKMQECDQAIRKCDLVIGVVTDSLLLQVADACIQYRKSLISPASLNRQMVAKKALAKENNVLILMDCGFAPGLDHITAKKAIDNIHSKGGIITSFKTYSGSFVADPSADNPLGFKLTEPVGDLLYMGRQSNRHLLRGRLQHIPYHRLFERSKGIRIGDEEDMVVIPAGDSLYYRKIYDLPDASTILKAKLAPRGFERMWDIFIKLGLTDTVSKIDLCGEGSFYNLLGSFLPDDPETSMEERLQQYAGASSSEVDKLKWLGLFDTYWLEDRNDLTPANILQYLLETRLTPLIDDRDTVMMEHQLAYEFRDEHYEFRATLISKGADQHDSALGSAIGLTCGAAAKLVLSGAITVKGLHIPTIREIYDPILNELSDSGVAFHVEEKRVSDPEAVVK